jgi:hypothetical protein
MRTQLFYVALILAMSKPDKLWSSYCSCVLQVRGSEGLKGHTKTSSSGRLPFAVCSKSVLQGRGRPGPGALACRFTKQVLSTYDESTLRGWLLFEGVAGKKQVDAMDKRQLVTTIHDYLQSKQPVHAIKVAHLSQRHPHKAPRITRAKGQGKKSPQAKRRPVPKLRVPPGSPARRA